jgi:hypothetical protein
MHQNKIRVPTPSILYLKSGGQCCTFVVIRVNPLTPMRWWTDAHFHRFLTVLEYSLIGEKFPLTTAPHALYIKQEKNRKILKLFLF